MVSENVNVGLVTYSGLIVLRNFPWIPDIDSNICKNSLLPNEQFYWSLVLILYFGIPIIVVIISYIGLVSSVQEIRRNIVQIGRSNRNGSGFQKTIVCVIGGFILCWAPTILLQLSQVTGLSPFIFTTKNFCNNFKEFAKEGMHLEDKTATFSNSTPGSPRV